MKVIEKVMNVGDSFVICSEGLSDWKDNEMIEVWASI